ncbi:hypothetical protein NM208_g1274 [Fusarium decemcellulare]|uniref:Uncharacterized protein n=1 Tax=Fusarium decemcellulare TaxID=57161 RepID=A0ACC1SWW9_9HYPO|nr:hypothetical protein NM208_g1274 [Fusarium decemcellulare]
MATALKRHALKSIARRFKFVDNFSALTTLQWDIESPRVILVENKGPGSYSALCGTLVIDVHSDQAQDVNLSASLFLRLARRPFSDGDYSIINIGTWSPPSFPKTFAKGTYRIPFSISIPGDAAGTADTPDVSIAYGLAAALHVSRTGDNCERYCDSFHLKKRILVKRVVAAAKAQTYHHAPLSAINATFNAIFSGVIKPHVRNMMTIRLENLLSFDKSTDRYQFWQLNKFTWRLEETTRYDTVTTRILAMGSLCKGWKTNWWKGGGSTYLEFEYKLRQYSDDVEAFHGIEVRHALIIEMILSRVSASMEKPHLIAVSGTGWKVCVSLDVVLSSDWNLTATDAQYCRGYERLESPS